MSLKIAIQPDDVVHPNGRRPPFSARWAELAQAKHIYVVPVDVFAGDAMARISGCDAFTWRCPSSPHIRAYAKRFLHALEAGFGMPVFPSLKSSWYFEDKIAQGYFFSAADIPCARTDVFWTQETAEQFCEHAACPFVLKLTGGHQSVNVRLVRSRGEAKFYVEELFGHGVRRWATGPLRNYGCCCAGCGRRPGHSKGTIPIFRVSMQNCITCTSTRRNSCPETSSRFQSSSRATAPLRLEGSFNPVIFARAAVPDAWTGALSPLGKTRFGLPSAPPGNWGLSRWPLIPSGDPKIPWSSS